MEKSVMLATLTYATHTYTFHSELGHHQNLADCSRMIFSCAAVITHTAKWRFSAITTMMVVLILTSVITVLGTPLCGCNRAMISDVIALFKIDCYLTCGIAIIKIYHLMVDPLNTSASNASCNKVVVSATIIVHGNIHLSCSNSGTLSRILVT